MRTKVTFGAKSANGEFRSFDPKNDSDRKIPNYEKQIGIGNRLIFGIIEIGPLSSENKPPQISDTRMTVLQVILEDPAFRNLLDLVVRHGLP